ncbi:hypothetical protein PGT21_032989 [Puccinia graminis f. sp. tritici]|uniref:Uncharacterized protein n=1 Tax=Puccinia graminis f. sp. tritici TaxID=56615 RepID=A0A5B0NHS3_PUCGR|nr:hypothetical protein PGT21_032989 [Puccinia graminis f. sp. tritici]
MSCKPVGLQLLKSPPPPSSPSSSPLIGFSAPQARRSKNMRGALTFLRIIRGSLDHSLSHRTGSRALIGQVVDRGKGPQLIPRSCRLIGQNQGWLPMREVHVGSLRALLVARGSAGPSLSGSPGSVGTSAGPRASNPYPLRSQMSLPQPPSPLERNQMLGSPIRLDSRASSRPPILNASPIAPPSSVRGQASGFPIEIDSQGSAPSPLADPRTIARPVSPKATRASRAQRVPPGLVGLLPHDQGGASTPYQHCPTPLLDPNPPFPPQATPEWRHPALNSRGSSGSPVACRPFKVASSSLNHLLSLLSSNRAVIDEPWTLPPAPLPRNLSTPSDIRSAVNVDCSTSTSVSQDESEASDENHSESSSNQYTASSNQSYPFARQPRVASPDPPGFYDANEFHLLRDHQIDSLLSRRADPARFDRYAFCPREFTAFYQSAASSFVAYCNAERPSCPHDQAHRIKFFLV